jgi:hypothetical protein
MNTDADPSASAGNAQASHLDSFFESSQWTREDIQTVAALWVAFLLTLGALGYLDT